MLKFVPNVVSLMRMYNRNAKMREYNNTKMPKQDDVELDVSHFWILNVQMRKYDSM